MNFVSKASRVRAVKAALRDARVQLSLLNHHVGARAAVRDADFDCLDLISIHGPVSPTRLAKIAGTHPATLTGVLDRLEQGGWIVRERDADDRRGVVVRLLPARNAEVRNLYSTMDALVDGICATYEPEQLDLVTDFLRRIEEAGARATAELAP